MKILLLSWPNSIHTIRWALALADRDIEVCIFGFEALKVKDYDICSNIMIKTLNQSLSMREGSFEKLKYLSALPRIKEIIKEFNPNIVHAHYASSYGLLGALSGNHPFVISVWGADVYSFPLKSFLHRKLLEYSLSKADKVLSTSFVMVQETNKYTTKQIEVTPFGVDLKQFTNVDKKDIFEESDIIIGTIKALEEKYGIKYLIEAFCTLSKKYPKLPLKLLIVGGGSLEKELKALVDNLGLNEKILFTGKIEHKDIASYHACLDIFVSLSISDSESFGVSVVEASASEKPVLVSNVGGLVEVVEDKVTGYVVNAKNTLAAADALEKLVLDVNLRKDFGNAGRKRVEDLYDWDKNVNKMIDIYKGLLG